MMTNYVPYIVTLLVIHGQLWTIHVYLMRYCCVATPLLTCIQLITFTNMVVGTAYNYNCFNVMNSFTNFNFDFHFVLACFGGNLIICCMLMHFLEEILCRINARIVIIIM